MTPGGDVPPGERVTSEVAATADCRTAVVDATGSLLPGASGSVVAWWSFSKTLVAACVLLLAERGRLSLDDCLDGLPCDPSRSLPGGLPRGFSRGCSFTLRQLLQHRAGVGNYGEMPEYHEAVAAECPPWSDEEMLRRVPPDELLFAPGEGWAYSNVGYLLVRRHLERVEDEPLEAVLRRLVLAPLALERCRVAATVDDMRRIAYPPAHAYDPRWVYHGCVVGPVRDAALALHHLLHGTLLSTASRAALLDRHPIGGPIAGRPWQSHGYGLGVMMGSMGSQAADALEVVGHSAGGPGSVGAVYSRRTPGGPRTAAAFAPGNDVGITEDVALRLIRSNI